jgi:hypothetical protein
MIIFSICGDSSIRASFRAWLHPLENKHPATIAIKAFDRPILLIRPQKVVILLGLRCQANDSFRSRPNLVIPQKSGRLPPAV